MNFNWIANCKYSISVYSCVESCAFNYLVVLHLQDICLYDYVYPQCVYFFVFMHLIFISCSIELFQPLYDIELKDQRLKLPIDQTKKHGKIGLTG